MLALKAAEITKLALSSTILRSALTSVGEEGLYTNHCHSIEHIEPRQLQRQACGQPLRVTCLRCSSRTYICYTEERTIAPKVCDEEMIHPSDTQSRSAANF
jgi:hypothetical protein